MFSAQNKRPIVFHCVSLLKQLAGALLPPGPLQDCATENGSAHPGLSLILQGQHSATSLVLSLLRSHRFGGRIWGDLGRLLPFPAAYDPQHKIRPV